MGALTLTEEDKRKVRTTDFERLSQMTHHRGIRTNASPDGLLSPPLFYDNFHIAVSTVILSNRS